MMLERPSPCLSCTRVKDPRDCENKNCQLWQRWFIARWEAMRKLVRDEMEEAPAPVGVHISGQTYAAPHQVQRYLQTDPCAECLCPRGLCSLPCRLKRNWLEARKDVLL